jgi:TolB-like protein
MGSLLWSGSALVNVGNVFRQSAAAYTFNKFKCSDWGGRIVSDADTLGAGADLKQDDKPAVLTENLHSNRLSHRLRNIGAAIASVAAVGAVIGGLTGYWNAWKVINDDLLKVKTQSPTVELTISKGPSVAALPIANPTKATGLDPIADTLAQQLVSSLGKFSLLRVIPRGTTTNFVKQDDAIEAARKAGVDYLVTGEVRPRGKGPLVNIQVADLHTGGEIWSRSFDASAEEVETGTDSYEIGDVAAAQINGAIENGEYRKIQNKPIAELNSYECIIQSRVGAMIGSQSAGLRALECSKRLTDKEPNNALGWAARATVLGSQRFLGFGLAPDAVKHFDKRTYLNGDFISAATRAVELAPDDAAARKVYAQAIGTKCQIDLYKQEVQKAIVLNPNDPFTLGVLGINLTYMGGWDEGSALAERAIRLVGPNASFIWWFGPAKRHFWRGEYQQALEDMLHAYFEGLWLSHLDQAYTLPFLNRIDDAREQVAKLQKVWPGFTISEANSFYRMYCFPPEFIERMNGGLRQAGLPE